MRFSRMWLCVILLAGSLAIAGPIPVVNPGFETGDFTGWTRSGALDHTGVFGYAALSGSYGAYFGPVGGLGYIAQSVATVPGGAYDVTFYLLRGDGTPNQVELWWDGSLAATWTNVGIGPWTVFGWLDLVTDHSSTQLMLGFRHDPSYFYLDDVAVDGPSPIPEPSTVALLGTGLLLVLLRRRK